MSKSVNVAVSAEDRDRGFTGEVRFFEQVLALPHGKEKNVKGN